MNKEAKEVPCEDRLEMADGCLRMVHEKLEAYGMDLSGTPPMMYPEAIQSLVHHAVKDAFKEGFLEGDGGADQMEKSFECYQKDFKGFKFGPPGNALLNEG